MSAATRFKRKFVAAASGSVLIFGTTACISTGAPSTDRDNEAVVTVAKNVRNTPVAFIDTSDPIVDEVFTNIGKFLMLQKNHAYLLSPQAHSIDHTKACGSILAVNKTPLLSNRMNKLAMYTNTDKVRSVVVFSNPTELLKYIESLSPKKVLPAHHRVNLTRSEITECEALSVLHNGFDADGAAGSDDNDDHFVEGKVKSRNVTEVAQICLETVSQSFAMPYSSARALRKLCMQLQVQYSESKNWGLFVLGTGVGGQSRESMMISKDRAVGFLLSMSLVKEIAESQGIVFNLLSPRLTHFTDVYPKPYMSNMAAAFGAPKVSAGERYYILQLYLSAIYPDISPFEINGRKHTIMLYAMRRAFASMGEKYTIQELDTENRERDVKLYKFLLRTYLQKLKATQQTDLV